MSKPTCLDLRQLFGRDYKITDEESYAVEAPAHRRTETAWLTIMPCGPRGCIGVYGGRLLFASTDRRRVGKRLLALPSCRPWQVGDDGVNVLFDVDDFAAVSEVMRPHRRRQLTPAERQQAAERLRQFQFHPRRTHKDGGFEAA